MQFSIIALATFADLVAANPLSVKWWLKDCQKACLQAHLFQLYQGQFHIGQSTAGEFCALGPDFIKDFIQTNVLPCVDIVCGNCLECEKLGAKWLQNQCGTSFISDPKI